MTRYRKPWSDETREKMRSRIPWNKGKKTGPLPLSTIEKMRGRVPANKGVPMTPEQKHKVSVAKYKGKTTEAFRVRMSTAYAQWRSRVFLRDGYKCQICLKNSSKLNAHHIFSFSQYPEDRLRLSNGITLCEYCHMQEHQGWSDLLSVEL